MNAADNGKHGTIVLRTDVFQIITMRLYSGRYIYCSIHQKPFHFLAISDTHANGKKWEDFNRLTWNVHFFLLFGTVIISGRFSQSNQNISIFIDCTFVCCTSCRGSTKSEQYTREVTNKKKQSTSFDYRMSEGLKKRITVNIESKLLKITVTSVHDAVVFHHFRFWTKNKTVRIDIRISYVVYIFGRKKG